MSRRLIYLCLAGIILIAAGIIAIYVISAQNELEGDDSVPPPRRVTLTKIVREIHDLSAIIAELPPVPIPAPIPPQQPLPNREREAAEDRWFNQKVITISKRQFVAKPWSQDSLNWLQRAWCHVRGHCHREESEPIALDGRRLVAVGCNDPIVLGFYGIIHPELPIKEKNLEQSLKLLGTGPWPRLFHFWFHLEAFDLGEASCITHENEAVANLHAVVKDESIADDETGAGIFLDIVYDKDDFSRKHANRIATILAGPESRLAPWARATAMGTAHIDLAWRSRGSGWASEVTEEGWKGFNAHLILARSALERAQILAPQRWEPGRRLITVSMGQGGDEAVEQLNKALSLSRRACSDYEPAMDRLLNALRPRWHGSVEVMLNHAMEWLSSTDYDCSLPFIGLSALSMVDLEMGNSGKVYRIPAVNEAIKKTLIGYLANPAAPYPS